jgi:hypothetical protein
MGLSENGISPKNPWFIILKSLRFWRHNMEKTPFSGTHKKNIR